MVEELLEVSGKNICRVDPECRTTANGHRTGLVIG